MDTLRIAVAQPPNRVGRDTAERHVAISAALLAGESAPDSYHKRLLSTYDLSDEARTFAPGQQPSGSGGSAT